MIRRRWDVFSSAGGWKRRPWAEPQPNSVPAPMFSRCIFSKYCLVGFIQELEQNLDFVKRRWRCHKFSCGIRFHEIFHILSRKDWDNSSSESKVISSIHSIYSKAGILSFHGINCWRLLILPRKSDSARRCEKTKHFEWPEFENPDNLKLRIKTRFIQIAVRKAGTRLPLHCRGSAPHSCSRKATQAPYEIFEPSKCHSLLHELKQFGRSSRKSRSHWAKLIRCAVYKWQFRVSISDVSYCFLS